MSISILFNVPAATDPFDVQAVLEEAGYKTEVPNNGIMPASAKQGGKAIVHCVVSGATYQDILDVTAAQRPVWQIFGAQDLLPSPNPDYDPDDPDSEPTITVVHKTMNVSIWAFLPDRPVHGGGTEQQTELHLFQGSTPWPSR